MWRFSVILISTLCFSMPVAAQGFGGGLTKGVSAEELTAGYAAAPAELRYRVTSRNLPAPMQLIFEVQERSNGFTLKGQGIFEAKEDLAQNLYEMLERQMGNRVRFQNGLVYFQLSSRLDELRRAEETAMFGVSKWFQPNDCFAVIGDCESFQESALGLGEVLLVRTTESNGVWRAKATVKGSGRQVYTTSYTIDAAGFLIDENRTETVDGLKTRTTVRRMETQPEG